MKGCRDVGINVYIRNPACVFINTLTEKLNGICTLVTCSETR